jgi:hypothetical protein
MLVVAAEKCKHFSQHTGGGIWQVRAWEPSLAWHLRLAAVHHWHLRSAAVHWGRHRDMQYRLCTMHTARQSCALTSCAMCSAPRLCTPGMRCLARLSSTISSAKPMRPSTPIVEASTSGVAWPALLTAMSAHGQQHTAKHTRRQGAPLAGGITTLLLLSH